MSSHGSYQTPQVLRLGTADDSHEASESQVGLRPQGNVPSYSLPLGVSSSIEGIMCSLIFIDYQEQERRRMRQIGYQDAFNNKGTTRWKHSRFHQYASLVYSPRGNIRYRDAVGRVTTLIEEGRFLHPVDFDLARLMVKSTDEIYSGPDNATWRRAFIRNQAPWTIRMLIGLSIRSRATTSTGMAATGP